MHITQLILKSKISNFNQPIYLVNRPYSNNFNIRILNNSNPATSWLDDTSPTPQDLGQYVIVFHFKLLQKGKIVLQYFWCFDVFKCRDLSL